MTSALWRPVAAAVLLSLAAPLSAAHAAGLTGSPASMSHQHAVAVSESYSFLRTPADVRHLAAEGRLVEVTPGANFTLSGVSFPYARAEVRSFIEHFAAAYRDSTGSRLVVTSLTRPEALQPRNAHVLSVHPAGMAVDLRVPASAAARAFLERTLLAMERDGLLDVTREHTPAHYHIAVFADRYGPYAARQDSLAASAAAVSATPTVQRLLAAPAPTATTSDGDRTPLLLAFSLVALALLGVAAPAARREWVIRRTRSE